MSERIGFIGLGLMGGPMAKRLSEHFEVVAFDLDPARFEGLDSVVRAQSVAELASQAGTVLMSLPTTQAVEAVVLGSGGLVEAVDSGRGGRGSAGGSNAAAAGSNAAAGGSGHGAGAAGGGGAGSSPGGAGSGLGEGSLVIDMSTTQPLVSKKIAEAFAERGVEFVDAPVSGGPSGAQAGTLSIMAGGEASAYARAEPILSHVGGSVVHVGGPGSGGIAKLVNNMIVGAAFTSVAEGFALASAHDIDISTLHQAIRGGWAGSKVLDISAEAVSKGDFSPAGTVDLLSKDLGYARDLARSGNIPVPVTAIVDEVFTAAKARGTGGNAQPVIVELWEKLMNSEIAANAAERGTVDKSK